MTTTETRSDALRNGLGALAFARRLTTGMLEDIPEDQHTTPPCPGGNHAIWVAGHIALTDDQFRVGLGGHPPACPDSWRDLFGMGSKAEPDPSRTGPTRRRLKLNRQR